MRSKSLTILVVASLTVLASIGAASAASFADTGVDPDTGLGGLAQQTGDGFLGNNQLPDGVATFSGEPGWHVAVSDRPSLEDWADSSDQREILSYDNDTNTSVVRAPVSHIGTGFIDRTLGNGLHARSYVDSVAVVQEVDSPEPPEPVSREAFEAPQEPGLFNSLGIDLPGLGGPEYATDGIAMTEDANRSTLGEARETIDAESTTANGSGVTVAILDDGATYDEDLFGDRVVGARDFVADRPATANTAQKRD